MKNHEIIVEQIEDTPSYLSFQVTCLETGQQFYLPSLEYTPAFATTPSDIIRRCEYYMNGEDYSCGYGRCGTHNHKLVQ